MVVYRNFDQTALDAQYDLRPIWPDVPEVVAFRESESARVRGVRPLPGGDNRTESSFLREVRSEGGRL